MVSLSLLSTSSIGEGLILRQLLLLSKLCDPVLVRFCWQSSSTSAARMPPMAQQQKSASTTPSLISHVPQCGAQERWSGQNQESVLLDPGRRFWTMSLGRRTRYRPRFLRSYLDKRHCKSKQQKWIKWYFSWLFQLWVNYKCLIDM